MTETLTDLAIKADGLVRRFGDKVAVAGVDLKVAPGEIYGFLGPNGAGKSTTVRMLVTLIAPSEGRAEVAGYDVVTQPGQVRLRIGVALQDAALDPKQTGRELLDLQGRLYGMAESVRRTRLEQLAELVDIGDALDDRIATYSGGMKRRLDLAAALIHEPSVLFLDEPTTGLDPLSRQMVWEEVRRLNAQGVTIFLTTQYLEEADELANRVGIIADGRLVAEGPPEVLKRSIGSDVVLVKVVGDPAAVPDALARAPRRRASRRPRRHRRHLGDRRGKGREPGGGGDRRLRGDGGQPEPADPHTRRRVPGAHRRPPARGGPMTAAAPTAPTHTNLARPGGLLTDLRSVALRALRLTMREPEAVLPALIIPLFFFVVNVGALQQFVEASAPPGFSYKAFQLPLAIITAVTGVSRASSLVVDIQDGYFDRLLLTPIRRISLLLGLMVADFVLVVVLTIPVLILGFVLGVRFETGPLGVLVFILLSGFWGLVFTGFPYAIALKTGNPAAVNSSFLLFFPFVFLTTAFLPKEALTGWLAAIATVNPVTYMLAALRSLILVGWDWTAIGQSVVAIAVMGAVSMPLAFAALRGRLKRG